MMNNSEATIIPYHSTPVSSLGGVLVFAPHPDDEVFGCGGSLLLHAQNGQKIRVVLMTAGDANVTDGANTEYAKTRLAESAAAALVLGIDKPECWGLQDRSLQYSETFVNRIKEAIETSGAQVVYAPSLWEVHPDHRATSLSVIEAVRRIGKGVELFLYEVSAPLRPNCLVNVSSVWHRKAEAMHCFKSQNVKLAYPDFIQALNRFRALTLDESVNFAEGFEAYRSEILNRPDLGPMGSERTKLWDRGFVSIASEMPLVSVVVRTTVRSTLDAAINSVVCQTYPNIEIILVDVAGTGLREVDLTILGLPTRIATEGVPLGRSRAANAGLALASGDLCVFLDDDDWFYPDHLSKLVGFLVSNPLMFAAHTGVACVDPKGVPTGVTFDFPYAPRELMYGNFMPIHGVMFRRKLMQLGCSFDESFDLYEDWDFWQQVESRGPFGFVQGISAAYRIDALSGAGVRLDQELAKNATEQMYRKWSVLQSNAVFQELISRSLERRNLLRSLETLRSQLRNQDARLEAMGNDLTVAQTTAAQCVHDAHIARLDADHFRKAHDQACVDRDVARSVQERAEQYAAASRNETLQAYTELGLARADSKNAREAEKSVLFEIEAVRDNLTAVRQQLSGAQQQLLDRDSEIDTLSSKLNSTSDQLSLEKSAVEALLQKQKKYEHQIAELDDLHNSLRSAHENEKLQNAQLLTESVQLSGVVRQQEQHLAELEGQLAKSRLEIDEIRMSTSWKLTKPLRSMGRLVLRAKGLIGAVKSARRRQISWRYLLSVSWGVFQAEGIRGVVNRAGRIEVSDFGSGAQVQPYGELPQGSGSYSEWIRRFDCFDANQQSSLHKDLSQLKELPLISVVMPVHNPAREDLSRAIDSVLNQIYPHWELCICDDASTAPHVHEVLSAYEGKYKNIRVAYEKQNGHISRATNNAIGMAKGEYVAFLDHDDLLAVHALLRVAQYLAKFPEAMVLYSDEDKVDAAGHRFDPYFKSDFNLGLLRSHNYMCHFAVYRTGFLRELGGLQPGVEGAQDYDLALRAVDRTEGHNIVHIPHVLYHWRTAVGSTASGHAEKSYAFSAGQRALDAHYVRRGLAAVAVEAPEAGGMYRTKWTLSQDLPLVSIVIPTRNGEPILRQCLDSIKRTDYENYEIIVVDNGSDDAPTLALLGERQSSGEIKVLRDDSPFNFSALNNRAVREQTAGEFVLLLNNDIEVMNPEWMSEMVASAMEEGVGCVGARLWYPDGRLQHAGVILVCGVAGHAHKYLPRGQHGYMGRAVLGQDMIGVTAACLLVRRTTYLEVGGLDEGLAVAFNDVDFCLKVHSAGYRNYFTPYAELIHHESVTRGYEDTPAKQHRFRLEIEKMQQRWPSLIAHDDPFYSPNLTAAAEDFSLAWPPRRPLP
ncbi:MAG: hypothetical protein CFE44_05170 [Burkholderiales bacterium PBB4]|nr:MAG: hypothetical protein CFE44_05170 [Burkholderiales bacterium PBB4]